MAYANKIYLINCFLSQNEPPRSDFYFVMVIPYVPFMTVICAVVLGM